MNETAAEILPASLTLAGQAAALGVVLLVAERVFRRRLPAAWAAALWMLVLIRLVLPPGFQSPTSVSFWVGPWLVAPIRMSHPPHVAPPPNAKQEWVAWPKSELKASVIPESAPASRLSPSGWLLASWGVGSLIWICWMLRKNQEVRRLVRSSKEASGSWNTALQRAADEVDLRRLPRLRLTTQNHSPAVCGWFQPVILLPEALAHSLSPAGLRDVLAHELIHLRRGDLWLNLPQALIQALWWWNPVVWLTVARIRMWREQAVDDAVMALGQEAEASYPQTLVEVARFCAAHSTLSLGFVGILESRRSLQYRVLRLVNAPPTRQTRLGWTGWAVFLLVAILAVPMAFARRVEVVGKGPDASTRIKPINQVTGTLQRESSPPTQIADDRGTEMYVDQLAARQGRFIPPGTSPGDAPASIRFEGFSPDITAVLAAKAAEPGAVKIRSISVESSRSLPRSSASGPTDWRPWSAEAVENALAVGRPVLVLVTAKWDFSGRVFRRDVQESPEVRDRLDDLKALRLEADWTRSNPVIEALMKQYNRPGVPLVLWYLPGAEPVVLEVGTGIASLLEVLAPSADPKMNVLSVEVEEQGDKVRYRVQGKDVSREELRARLAELGKSAPETHVRIGFRDGGRFGSVLEVLEWSRTSGFSRFNLASTGSSTPLPAVPPATGKPQAPYGSEDGAVSGINRASRMALLQEFGLTWSELEEWARDNGVSIDSRSVEELRTLLLKRTMVPTELRKERDPQTSRWINLTMIEVGTGRLELALDEMQVETSGGARVVDTGAPLLPWPSQVAGGIRLDGATAMSGLMDWGRWKAMEKEIESRPDTLKRVTIQKRLTGRQDWGLSPVDSPTNHGENSGGPSDLISIQSDVRSDGVALNATVRPRNWSALDTGTLSRLPEIRRELVLQDGQVWVVACLEEPTGSEGSPARSQSPRPAKLIVLTLQANQP